MKFKSETFTNFSKFHKSAETQFHKHIKTFQCDLGGEFNNNEFRNFANQHGLVFRFSCPHTSSQNGRSERMIRRLNDIVRPLLMHAHLPPSYWVEALHTATYLHNILPTKRLNFFTPTFALYGRHPTYDHLRVFGCACYPNMSTTMPHKLYLRSTRCVFLGYPSDYRGYRCLDPLTGKVHISRHVDFNETSFPFTTPLPDHTYHFLDDEAAPHIYPLPTQPIMTTPPPSAQPYPTIPLTDQTNISNTTHIQPTPSTIPINPIPTTLPTTHIISNAPHNMQTRAKSGITKPNP